MPLTTLIETGALEIHLADPSFVIIDCRFDLKDTSAGERAYEDGHISGALYAHLDRDLSGAKTGTNGRHPLPDPRVFAETLGRFGIADDVQVVVYDQDSGMYAGRLWWMLRWMGHEAVAVLNGGFARWRAEGRPTMAGRETRAPRPFTARPRPDMTATTGDVEQYVQAGGTLIDARAPERFRGDVELVDRVAGHIPGAVNHYFGSNVNEQGTFRSAPDLAAGFRRSLGGASPQQTICYCGSGVTACQNLLALELAGMPGAKLYVGSWSEWSSSPDRPLERGAGKSG